MIENNTSDDGGITVGADDAELEALVQAALWVDEIEKGFSNTTGTGDSGTTARVFGTFLTWLQEKEKAVFVVATANAIDVLPPEFLRKGRFDEIFFVDLPTVAEREAIWAIQMRSRATAENGLEDVAAAPGALARLVGLPRGGGRTVRRGPAVGDDVTAPAAIPATVSPGSMPTAPPAAATPPPAAPARQLRWARFLPATVAEGPGRRAALWLQGCRIHCPGCFNPELWATRGGHVDEPAELAARLLAQARGRGVEGLTLLGGEPFDQAAALAVVARAFREAGLTVMTFTGYRSPALTAWAEDGREDVAALLAATDLLVDGPYLRDHPDRRRPWLGSTNQGLRALTPAYAAEVARLEREGGADRVELRLTREGGIEVNGWAEVAALEELLDGLDGARLTPVRRPTGPHLPRTTEGAPR